MGYRLSKIYTKTGDTGQTGLADGSRVAKSSARIHAIGEIDELNSMIGMIRAQLEDTDSMQEPLHNIQHQLFNVGGMLATPKKSTQLIEERHVKLLEQLLDKLNATLPPLTDFILPAGSEAVARTHLARAVCRRAERALVKLMETESIEAVYIAYINRLSDLLFVMSRAIAARTQEKEIYWTKHQD